jgi:Tfp pilus assembly protein PilN
MTRVGVHLGPQRVRAVVLSGWPRARVDAVEVPFDHEEPDAAVDALRTWVGRPRRIAVAVDLHLLRTKRITLPALSAAERRNILRLEPERFFAVRGEELVPAVCADDGLVFAALASALTHWIQSLERIAPIDVIEPTPVALARGLATAAIADAVVVFDGQDAGIAIAQIRLNRVTRARRLFGPVREVAAALATDGILDGVRIADLDPWTAERQAMLAGLCPGVALEPLPMLPATGSRAGAAGPFAAALGAALALDKLPPTAETLVSPAHEATIRRRRTRATLTAAVTCAVAFGFAVASLDSRAERTLGELDAATTGLTARAAPVLAMQTELASFERRADALRAIDDERADPLQVLQTLSATLPPGAFVRQIHNAGPDWQIDGYAPNASAVLTALGADTQFRDVHFLSAMTRDQIANHTYESFALAFRFVPTP